MILVRQDFGHGVRPEEHLQRDLIAILDEHVVEQHREVGFRDSSTSCMGRDVSPTLRWRAGKQTIPRN
jgi:hypothetical protein